jgi:hypothetical protein
MQNPPHKASCLCSTDLKDRFDHEDTFRKTSMTLELIQRPNSWT